MMGRIGLCLTSVLFGSFGQRGFKFRRHGQRLGRAALVGCLPGFRHVRTIEFRVLGKSEFRQVERIDVVWPHRSIGLILVCFHVVLVSLSLICGLFSCEHGSLLERIWPMHPVSDIRGNGRNWKRWVRQWRVHSCPVRRLAFGMQCRLV